MNPAVLLLYFVNFLVIGALPLVFFTRTTGFNLRWWSTALPFLLTPALLILGGLGLLPLLPGVNPSFVQFLELVSVPFAAASIALIFMTLGSHRVPLALWHQPGDAPKHIVTYGAYKHIRHPFYASFLLALAGAALAFPSLPTSIVFLYGLTILNVTAVQEEKRLSESEFGTEYREYVARTGRFVPRWRLTR